MLNLIGRPREIWKEFALQVTRHSVADVVIFYLQSKTNVAIVLQQLNN